MQSSSGKCRNDTLTLACYRAAYKDHLGPGMVSRNKESGNGVVLGTAWRTKEPVSMFGS